MYILTISFIEEEISHLLIAPTLEKLIFALSPLHLVINDYIGDIGIKLEKEISDKTSIVLFGYIVNDNSFETIFNSIKELILKD